MRTLLAISVVFFAGRGVAAAPPALPCANTDVKCAHEARLKSPVRQKRFWSDALAKPLDQRIGVAGDELLAFLNLDNIAESYPNRPTTVQLSADFLKDVNDAIAELPPLVKALVDRKLVGIYFIRDLGGTGLTDYARGGWFSRDAGFIVLDVEVLTKQTANVWATWKENTPFKADAAFKLEAVIENADSDNRKNAIQYILLHELGHILSIGENIHPRWDRPPSSVEKFPFARLSWEYSDGEKRYGSVFDQQFPSRKNVAYYFGAKLAGASMFGTYNELLTTNFPTLYAATQPGDDFAESFVSYVHTVIQKRPWEIRMYADGKLTKTVGSCWEEPRCAAKRKVLEEILGVK